MSTACKDTENIWEINRVRRRDFIAAAAAGAALPLFAKTPTRIGRSRLSAISDEIAATPAEALAFAKKYGLEWLELRNVPGAKTPYFFMNEAELKPVAKEFADHGIKISFLNTNLLKFGLPGTEPLRKNETAEARAKRLPREQAQFDRRMDDLQKCIRAAQVLGTDRVRVFTFQRVREPEKLFARIAEILEPMCSVAAREGARLLIENENSCNVATCAETAAILKLLPARTAGCNWDALNGANAGETAFPEGYEKLPKDRIWNIQFKGKSILDTPQRLDWAAIIKTLERDGYEGEIGLETHYFDGTNIEKAHASMSAMVSIVDPQAPHS